MKSSTLSIAGWVVLIFIWYVITALHLVNNHILPSPIDCIKMLPIMVNEYDLFKNIGFSLKINFLGYIEALIFALPVGYILGLFKTTRKMFSQPIDSLRFVPITALGGLFVALSGFSIWTKIHFLAFGIWVYLVPVIVQRIDEVSNVHHQMMKTLGATKFQTFKHLQWKSVNPRLSDDTRILIGISWTYIIVAELKNCIGGLGYMIALGDKQANIAIVYDAVCIIILIGVLQDKLMKLIDWLLYRFKYNNPESLSIIFNSNLNNLIKIFKKS